MTRSPLLELSIPIQEPKNAEAPRLVDVCDGIPGPSDREEATWGTLVSPDDARMVYSGRMRFSDPRSPVILWQGLAIQACFSGTSLGIRLRDSGNNHFNVVIDRRFDRPTLLRCRPGEHTYPLAAGLADTIHQLEVFRRTETFYGPTVFQGLVLEQGQSLLTPPSPASLRIEFYGDSMTVGACNEDGDEDQWNTAATHNNYRSYAAMTARALRAEARTIAVSGIGLTLGYQSFNMIQIWDRLGGDPASEPWDFACWTPDLVVVNLGENDKSMGVDEEFAPAYLCFLRRIREKYPGAHLFCLLGPMSAGHPDSSFRGHVQRAVHTLQRQGDERIHVHFFEVTCWKHPRVDVHKQMALELVEFIQSKLPLS